MSLSAGMVEQLYFLVTLISDSKSEADGSTLCSIDVKGPGRPERKRNKEKHNN